MLTLITIWSLGNNKVLEKTPEFQTLSYFLSLLGILEICYLRNPVRNKKQGAGLSSLLVKLPYNLIILPLIKPQVANQQQKKDPSKIWLQGLGWVVGWIEMPFSWILQTYHEKPVKYFFFSLLKNCFQFPDSEDSGFTKNQLVYFKFMQLNILGVFGTALCKGRAWFHNFWKGDLLLHPLEAEKK